MNRFATFLAALLAFLAVPALAAIPDLGGEPAVQEDEAVDPLIEAEYDADADLQIAERIAGIYAAIDSLSEIDVSVDKGVVTLTGSVAKVEQIEQAEEIAGRVAGVVTVESQIERDLAVQTNLAPTFGAIAAQAREVIRSLPLLGVAVLIAILVAFTFHLLAKLRGLWLRIAPNAFLAELLMSAMRFIGVLFGIYLALKILGATALLGAVLGIGGVIGIAIGFAVRDTIDNYISSVMLSLRQPFRANDHVVIEGEEGRVVRLTSRATVLMTLDGNHLRIPNSTVFKAVILNYTRNPERRFEFDLGVDADDDPVEAMRVGIEAMGTRDFVLTDPEPQARICEVGDSNIVLRFFGWVDQAQTDYHKGRSMSIAVVKDALEDEGFALPEPIYRLRMDPRTAPIPTSATITETMPEESASAPPAPPPAPSPAPSPERKRRTAAAEAEAHSTRPDTHIEDLVTRERAETGEKDLLDSGRPIE